MSGVSKIWLRLISFYGTCFKYYLFMSPGSQTAFKVSQSALQSARSLCRHGNGVLICFSNSSPSLLVGFSIQDEIMDICPSVPLACGRKFPFYCLVVMFVGCSVFYGHGAKSSIAQKRMHCTFTFLAPWKLKIGPTGSWCSELRQN